MKKYVKYVCLVFAFLVTMAFANQAKAVPIAMDYTGSYSISGNVLDFDGWVGMLTYSNGTTSPTSPPSPLDPLLLSSVNIDVYTDGSTIGSLSVGTSGMGFTADVNAKVFTPSQGANILFGLSNITGTAGSSLWLTQFLASAATLGNKSILELALSVSSSTNAFGKVITPEPGTIALLGIGLAGLVGVGVRRRMKKKVD